MSVTQRLLLVAVLSAIVLPPHASWAGNASSWEGVWSGQLGAPPHAWPISVTISQAKVVSFSEKGVALKVSYSKITPTLVAFGDHANYATHLVRTSDGTASMTIRGRHGVETGSLNK